MPLARVRTVRRTRSPGVSSSTPKDRRVAVAVDPFGSKTRQINGIVQREHAVGRHRCGLEHVPLMTLEMARTYRTRAVRVPVKDVLLLDIGPHPFAQEDGHGTAGELPGRDDGRKIA